MVLVEALGVEAGVAQEALDLAVGRRVRGLVGVGVRVSLSRVFIVLVTVRVVSCLLRGRVLRISSLFLAGDLFYDLTALYLYGLCHLYHLKNASDFNHLTHFFIS